MDVVPSDVPSLRYIHEPYYYAKNTNEGSKTLKRGVLNTLTRLVVGNTKPRYNNQRYIANSEWTSEMISKIHGVRPSVILPPLEVDEIRKKRREWTNRESGFVWVGRITRDKDPELAIQLIENLRNQNSISDDVHLHIVGPLTNSGYGRRIESLSAERDYISLEGMVDRDTLIDLMGTHKYGINTRENEFFGLSVAEMVTAGTLPFVPESGGQQEIVKNIPDLLYETETEARQKIIKLLGDQERQTEIRAKLDDETDRFSTNEFKTTLKRAVRELMRENMGS